MPTLIYKNSNMNRSKDNKDNVNVKRCNNTDYKFSL